MPYFGYSRYPAKARTRSTSLSISSAFCSPSGRPRTRSKSSRFFSSAWRRPSSKRCVAAPGSKLSRLLTIIGTSIVGRSPHLGRVMSISPTHRLPYLSRKSSSAARTCGPPSRAPSASRKRASSKPSASTWRRNATTSGYGRAASATSSSANPISEVTL